MANTQAVSWGLTLRVDETIDVDVDKSPAGDQTLVTSFDLAANPVITHQISGMSGTLNAGTTPAVTKVWSSRVVLSGGAYDIDLTGMIGQSGTKVDFSGLELILIAIKNNGDNDMTFTSHATNGYPLWGDQGGLADLVIVPAGARIEFYTNDGIGQVVDGTHKIIDVAGTTTQNFDIILAFG